MTNKRRLGIQIIPNFSFNIYKTDFIKSVIIRAILPVSVFLLAFNPATAQHYFDSLQKRYAEVKDKDDTTKILALASLAIYYEYTQVDSAFIYARKIIELSDKLDYDYGKLMGLRSTLFIVNFTGNYPKALEIAMSNLRIIEQFKNHRIASLSLAHHDIGLITREMKDFEHAKKELYLAMSLQKEEDIWPGDAFGTYTQLGIIHLQEKHTDSALYYVQKGYELSQQMKYRRPFMCLATSAVGNVYESLGDFKSAMHYYRLAISQANQYDNNYIRARIYNNLASLFNKTGLRDSCIYFALISLELCRKYNYGDYASYASGLLAKVYESENQSDSALKYIKVMLAAKDTIFSQSKMQQVQLLVFDESQRQKEIDAAKERYRNEIRVYALLFIIFVFLLLSVILYRNNLQRKKINGILVRQKNELETTLAELKSTQAKLIHSEKMASLGELTAGIAHEIQNPLNFVNNFSDVNEELIVEMKEAIQSGNSGEAMQLADNIKDNLTKISHHGQRADSIVKGMLQHSRVGTGRKEPTDINALADEYLRLSYHGMRTKDKTFNASIKTDFDTRLGKIMLEPQSIGRVLLNLINNALYSLNEKRKKSDEDYEPSLTVSTRKIPPGAEGWPTLEIKISDNGMGVSGPILGKIFQPFFTTKGPGMGTGLGLSLAYDIVNKEHGGQIDVDTHEGEYAEFIIRIPLKENLK